jgi:uncharacterized membrane protein HdeD (DUF308 family)
MMVPGPSTTVIAQVVGIFFAVMGISMVVNSKGTAAAMEASVQNKGILWLWGMLALLIGAVIVVINHASTFGLPLLVTILGCLAMVKGAFILIFPHAAASLYGKFNQSGMLVFCGVVAVILGLVLFFL